MERFRAAEAHDRAHLPDHQPRDHPDAGRGGAGPGGRGPGRGDARHAGAQPGVGRVRQGLRLLAQRPSGRSCTRSRSPTTRPSTRPRSRAYLDAHPEIRVVSVVHSETPSGHAQPGRARSGPSARARGVVTIVDCVASFGGIELEAEAWQLDLLVAGPQKCLGGPPGMSLMAVSDAGVGGHRRQPDGAARAPSCRMLDWRDTWHGKGRFPFTPSVSDLHGVAGGRQADARGRPRGGPGTP